MKNIRTMMVVAAMASVGLSVDASTVTAQEWAEGEVRIHDRARGESSVDTQVPSIDDLRTVANARRIGHDQHGTSQVVFRHPVAGQLTVPAHRPIKPVYIRMFVEFVSRAGEQDED